MAKSCTTNERSKAIELAISQIEKQFGKGSIMKIGDGVGQDIASIPSGSIMLDWALGIGGIPRGRVVEIYGPESSGKTTLALHVVAEAQRAGGTAAFVDAEHAIDVNYSANLGVNIDELLVSQPDTGEQALDIVEMLVRSGAMDVIVIDSVAALVPRAEIEGEMSDMQVGLQARLMSKALRKLTAVLAKSDTCAIFINQIREKIGVMFGNPETTTGGRALKFYSSVRLDIRRIGAIKPSPWDLWVEADILFGHGISREGEVLDIAVEHDIINKNGMWYTYNSERVGQGRENARSFLKQNPELFGEVSNRVREILGLAALPTPNAEAASEPKPEPKPEPEPEKPKAPKRKK